MTLIKTIDLIQISPGVFLLYIKVFLFVLCTFSSIATLSHVYIGVATTIVKIQKIQDTSQIIGWEQPVRSVVSA